MTDAQFQSFLDQTDFAPITISTAQCYLSPSCVHDMPRRAILAAELNVAAAPLLGLSIYHLAGSTVDGWTVNALLAQAYTLYHNGQALPGDLADAIGYISGGALGDGRSGEGQSAAHCRLSAPCTTPTSTPGPPTATRTAVPATATRTSVPATATRTAVPPTATDTPTAGTCYDNPLGPAADFNVFVLGDAAQSGSDTEGRMAGGGTARLTNFSVGDRLPNSHGTRDDLIVGGNLTFSSGQVSNGNVVYAGTGSLTNVGLPNGTARRGTAIDFNAAGQTLRANSATLAAYPANGTTSVQYNQITLPGNDPQVNIFTVSGSRLASATAFTVRVPANSLVLVNINGMADRMQNFGFSINGTDRTHIVYNFYQATSLTLSGIGVEGSVLAPNAAVTFNSGQLNGTLAAASLSGGGQTNYNLLDTCVP